LTMKAVFPPSLFYTMPRGHPINWTAIGLCAVADFVIGFVWYTFIFSDTWVRALRQEKNDKSFGTNAGGDAGGMFKPMFAGVVGSIVQAFVLAHAVGYSGADSVSDGLQLGWWIWLGFHLAVAFPSALWESRNLTVIYVDQAKYLVVSLVMGAILAHYNA